MSDRIGSEPRRFDTMPSNPQRASVPEYDIARLGNVLVQLQSGLIVAQQSRQLAFAVLQRLSPQVLSVQLQQVEGVQEHVAILAPLAKLLKYRQPTVVTGKLGRAGPLAVWQDMC